MDVQKRERLMKTIKAQPGWDDNGLAAVVTVDEFFDGNDDLASIGCNLPEHPGLSVFWKTLKSLSIRPDVREVWMEIYDADEGDWPFSETVFVVGDLSLEALRQIAEPLMPSEISDYYVAHSYPRAPNLRANVRMLWWD